MPILGAFERSTDDLVGIVSRFDSEPSERSKLIASLSDSETQPPACDVIWNTGVIESLLLQKRGLLKPRKWAVEPGWPSDCIASDGSWCGFAAIARVLIINTTQLPDATEYPTSVLELADPKWKGRCAVGQPTVGFSATHFAILREQLGHDETIELIKRVRDSAMMLAGDRQVAIAVAAGQAAWGLTDSASAIAEVDLRHPVVIVFPDQGPSQSGTLRIPSTTAVLRNAKHPVSAAMLADYLVQPATEDRLSMGNGSELPLSRRTKFPPRVLTEKPVRWMKANFESIAESYEEWIGELHALLEKPQIGKFP
jgi:iron(III) transport system substrate-binding protein